MMTDTQIHALLPDRNTFYWGSNLKLTQRLTGMQNQASDLTYTLTGIEIEGKTLRTFVNRTAQDVQRNSIRSSRVTVADDLAAVFADLVDADLPVHVAGV